MTTVNIHQAKTHLSRLLAKGCSGRGSGDCPCGNPRRSAHVLYGSQAARALWAATGGLFEVPDDFDAPLPEDVLAGFES